MKMDLFCPNQRRILQELGKDELFQALLQRVKNFKGPTGNCCWSTSCLCCCTSGKVPDYKTAPLLIRYFLFHLHMLPAAVGASGSTAAAYTILHCTSAHQFLQQILIIQHKGGHSTLYYKVPVQVINDEKQFPTFMFTSPLPMLFEKQNLIQMTWLSKVSALPQGKKQ